MPNSLSVVLSNKTLQNYIHLPYMSQLLVTKAGYFSNLLDHSISREIGVDEYILIYCISGSGYIGDFSSTFPIQKGDLILISPHTAHTYGTNPTDPWSILWVHFFGSQAHFLTKHLLPLKAYSISTIGYQPYLVDLFNSLLHIFSPTPNELAMLRTTTYLQQILCETIHLEQLSYKQQKSFKDIRQVIYFMKTNLDKKLTLDDMAKVANLSKYHFSRKFKAYTEDSPLDYFNTLKIKSACELLQTTDSTIKEISETLGFSTPYYFSECFKQLTGYSPSQYKYLIHSKF